MVESSVCQGVFLPGSAAFNLLCVLKRVLHSLCQQLCPIHCFMYVTQPLSATLSYPLFFTLQDVFAGGSAMTDISDSFSAYSAAFSDPSLLGTFIDNHDNAVYDITLFKVPHHTLQSTTSPSSKYHTTLFKVPHHPLQSTTSTSSKYHTTLFKVPHNPLQSTTHPLQSTTPPLQSTTQPSSKYHTTSSKYYTTSSKYYTTSSKYQWFPETNHRHEQTQLEVWADVRK